MLSNLIVISPEIQSGAPVFAGTRVPVKNLFDYLRGGDTIEEFLEDFPSVSREQVLQFLALIADAYTLHTNDHEENTPRREPAAATPQ